MDEARGFELANDVWKRRAKLTKGSRSVGAENLIREFSFGNVLPARQVAFALYGDSQTGFFRFLCLAPIRMGALMLAAGRRPRMLRRKVILVAAIAPTAPIVHTRFCKWRLVWDIGIWQAFADERKRIEQAARQNGLGGDWIRVVWLETGCGRGNGGVLARDRRGFYLLLTGLHYKPHINEDPHTADRNLYRA